MPELPEVEALRLGLQQVLPTREIVFCRINTPKIVSGKGNKREVNDNVTNQFIAGVTGKKIVSVNRRAKNIMVKLSGGDGVLVHLKMTGQLIYNNNSEEVWGGHPIESSHEELPNKHTAIEFRLDDGSLYYNDTRKFGYVLYFDDYDDLMDEVNSSGYGLEPLDADFSLSNFIAVLESKGRGSIKKMFLDQKVVVGLGNIYADEVCHRAGVRPDKLVKDLSKLEIERIYEDIRQVLPHAVELGGSSVADYLLADGSRGNYAREHRVYKRSGKECLSCQRPLTTIKHAGRTTVFCESCQS